MKSPFAEMLYYTQKVFFEAGLLNLWQNELTSLHVARDRKDHMWIEVDSSGLLSFDDLVSTWVLLMIGLLTSLAVFGLEFLMKYFNISMTRIVRYPEFHSTLNDTNRVFLFRSGHH